MHKFFWFLVALFALSFENPARASGDDGGCGQTMKIDYNSFTTCDSMGLISPGNDTRINLIYLLSDARGQKLKLSKPSTEPNAAVINFWPSDWSNFRSSLDLGIKPAAVESDSEYGEGTICVSDETGSAAFLVALAVDKNVTDAEKLTLGNIRKTLKCKTASGGDASIEVQSPAAKEFAAYIYAVRHFYFVSHTDGTGFAAIGNSSQPWVREAARYMQARVALLGAQASAFDEFGTLQKEHVSSESVKAALDSLNAYLKDYPNGAYAASATGLLRRAYWVSGDTQKLAEAYSEALGRSNIDEAGFAVVNELDLKLPTNADQGNPSDVLLLAMEDLRSMRERTDSDGKVLPGMKAQDIETQHSRFANHEDIYNYLLAARAWFVDKDATAVLQLLPERNAAGDAWSYVEFSGQLLRASALNATGNISARTALVNLFPKATQAFQRGTLELALAMLDERAKNISSVFAPDSLVQEPTIRQNVLDYIAGPILLRQQAIATNVSKEESKTALFRLLARDLTQGHFKGFLEDVKLLPPKPVQDANGQPYDNFEPFRWEGSTKDYSCPSVIEIAKQLSENESSIHGRLCLGDFIRAKGDFAPTPVEKDELGGTGTLFAGEQFYRQVLYVSIMKNSKATHQEKAYALFRAVKCYEPAHINDCGGAEVSKNQRKKWYNELKAKYADTSYAKELRYFW